MSFAIRTYPKKSTRPAAVVAAAVAAVAVLLAGNPVAQAGDSLALDSGHLNAFNVTAKNGKLNLDVKEDITGSNVERLAEDVVFDVWADGWTEATTELDEIGESGYVLPQGYHQGMLRPGWTTLQARWEGFTDVDIHFDEVRGPGNVYLFSADGRGRFAASAADGDYQLHPGSVIDQNTPAHLHSNWMFTKPGIYTMKVTASSNGVYSNQATYVWRVGYDKHNREIMDEQLSLERLQSLAAASLFP